MLNEAYLMHIFSPPIFSERHMTASCSWEHFAGGHCKHQNQQKAPTWEQVVQCESWNKKSKLCLVWPHLGRAHLERLRFFTTLYMCRDDGESPANSDSGFQIHVRKQMKSEIRGWTVSHYQTRSMGHSAFYKVFLLCKGAVILRPR